MMMIGNLTQKRKVKLNRFWVFQIFEVEIERGQMGEGKMSVRETLEWKDFSGKMERRDLMFFPAVLEP